jgi:hypothetical protein
MKKNFLFFGFLVSFIFLIENVSAHCPLCTIGAGAAAAGAVWLGVSKVVVALFIGAFAMSMAMWFARIIKKQYIPFQKTLIILVVFFTTVLPLMPIFSAIGPLYIPFIGTYGTTYAFNYSLASSLFGALIVFLSPFLSKKITSFRNGKIIPFQGTLLTLILLIIVGGLIQLIV